MTDPSKVHCLSPCIRKSWVRRNPTRTGAWEDAQGVRKEVSNYTKSATLFCPISGAAAGRFTSAVVLDLGPKTIEGLHKAVAQQEEGADSMDVMEEPKAEVEGEAPNVHTT